MKNQEYKRLNIKDAVKLFFSFSLGIYVQAIINFFSIPIITYLISPEEFGKATMYLTIYQLLLVISLFGMVLSFVRSYYEFKAGERNKLLWSALIVPFAFFALLSVILVPLSEKISKLIIGNIDSKLGLLLSLSLITGILQSFNTNQIRMQKKGVLYSTIFAIYAITNVTATILYAKLFGGTFYAIVFGQIMANLLAFLVGFTFEHSNILPVKIELSTTKSLLKYGLPLVPSEIIFWLYQFTSRYSLRAFSNFTELGYYGLGLKLANVMALVTAGFNLFWVPVAFETFEKDRENIRLFVNASEIICLVMIGFSLTIILIKDLIFMIMSKSYLPASPVVPFLLLMPALQSVLTITGNGIKFMKKTYWSLISYSTALLLNILLNWLLVPHFGARGAGLSMAISYTVLFTLETFISVKLFPVPYPLREIYTAIILFFLSAGVSTFVNKPLSNTLVTLTSIALLLLTFKSTLQKGIQVSKGFITNKLASKFNFPDQRD